MQSEFLAFVSDEISYATAFGWAERQGFPTSSVQRGGPQAAAASLDTALPPRLLLVDIDNSPDVVTQTGQLASRCGKETKVIALGTANDVNLYRQLLSTGVGDYLVKPLTPEQLSSAMASILRGDSAANSTKDAKIAVIIGTRGGAGATTVSTNLAWLLAHEFGHQTTLVDLDLQYGTTALSLDLEPGHGLRDLLSSASRVDNLMVTGALISAADRLSVLGTEEAIDDQIPIDGTAVTALMKELRPSNDFIIVDMPRYQLPHQKRLLATAHEIILVTDLSLVGIRDTLRLKTSFKSLGCPARVTLVANRVSKDRPSPVDEATFVKGVQARIDFSLPDDFKDLAAASNSGKSLASIAPHSALTRVLSTMAEHLAHVDQGEAVKKKGLFGWLKGGNDPDGDSAS